MDNIARIVIDNVLRSALAQRAVCKCWCVSPLALVFRDVVELRADVHTDARPFYSLSERPAACRETTRVKRSGSITGDADETIARAVSAASQFDPRGSGKLPQSLATQSLVAQRSEMAALSTAASSLAGPPSVAQYGSMRSDAAMSTDEPGTPGSPVLDKRTSETEEIKTAAGHHKRTGSLASRASSPGMVASDRSDGPSPPAPVAPHGVVVEGPDGKPAAPEEPTTPRRMGRRDSSIAGPPANLSPVTTGARTPESSPPPLSLSECVKCRARREAQARSRGARRPTAVRGCDAKARARRWPACSPTAEALRSQ